MRKLRVAEIRGSTVFQVNTLLELREVSVTTGAIRHEKLQ